MRSTLAGTPRLAGLDLLRRADVRRSGSSTFTRRIRCSVLSCRSSPAGACSAVPAHRRAVRTAPPAPAKPVSTAVVNLNTASATDLEGLPGIGAKTAARIVEYRQKNGPFKKIEELMNVRGVGEKNFLKLKPQITRRAGEGRSRSSRTCRRITPVRARRASGPKRMPWRRSRSCRGYSLLELIMVMATGRHADRGGGATALAGLDDVRARGAAHHVSGRLQRARMEAVKRSAMVGVQFTPDGRRRLQLRRVSGRQPERRAHARHPERRSTRLLAVAERLPDQFPGVEFGAAAGFAAGRSRRTRLRIRSHPIGIGQHRQLFRRWARRRPARSTSAAAATCSTRVRIFGETGKTRMLKLDSRARAMETAMKDELTRSPRDPASGRVRGTPHRIGAGTSWTPRAADRRVVARSALSRDQATVCCRAADGRTRRSRAEPIAHAFRGRVLRCAVVRLRPTWVCYRGADRVRSPSAVVRMTNAGKLLPRR